MTESADIAHAPVPALVPPRSPQELRAWTVEDYGRMARRFGEDIDQAAIERRALADLTLADAVKRESPPPLPPSVDTVRAWRETRQDKVDARAATVGAEIQRGQEGQRQFISQTQQGLRQRQQIGIAFSAKKAF